MAKEYLPNSETYLAIKNDEIVGFISIVKNYLAALFVLDDMQGLGIGTKLLNYVKGNRDKIKLKVYKNNPNSILFYASRDFSIISEGNDENTGEIELSMEWNK